MKTSKVNCGTIAGVIEPPFAYTTFNYGVASQYAMWVPHLGTSNVGFLDSHVVTVTQQFILSGCKDWQGNPSDGWKPGLAPFKLPS